LVAKEKVPRASLQALPEHLELSRETPQPREKHTRRLNSLSMNRQRQWRSDWAAELRNRQP